LVHLWSKTAPEKEGELSLAGTVRHARLDSRAARARLKRGRQPHWQAIVPRRVHLGYQRWPEDREGRWILRHYKASKYTAITLGHADDADRADGSWVLSYEQALAAVRAAADTPQSRVHRMTVRQAMERYVEFKRSQGQPVKDLISRSAAHILPPLGDLVVEELSAERLRRWLATMAAAPAQTRPKAGKPQYQPDPATDEDVRRRRASANRVLSMLKAALNHAYDEGHVPRNDAWGRKLKPFRDVEVARVRYLSVVEAKRLINAADTEFRPLVVGALQTGARYSELTRLEVSDFNPDAGSIAIRKSKTGRARHVILTDEGVQFFRQHCAGRAGHELMFMHADGSRWRASEQGRPMAAACARAKLKHVTLHTLRHTWASLAAMAGVPMPVIAANVGHSGTRTTEKHYAHLSPSHMRDAIRAGAPKFGLKPGKLVPLR
jgi:integrase